MAGQEKVWQFCGTFTLDKKKPVLTRVSGQKFESPFAGIFYKKYLKSKKCLQILDLRAFFMVAETAKICKNAQRFCGNFVAIFKKRAICHKIATKHGLRF